MKPLESKEFLSLDWPHALEPPIEASARSGSRRRRGYVDGCWPSDRYVAGRVRRVTAAADRGSAETNGRFYRRPLTMVAPRIWGCEAPIGSGRRSLVAGRGTARGVTDRRPSEPPSGAAQRTAALYGAAWCGGTRARPRSKGFEVLVGCKMC